MAKATTTEETLVTLVMTEKEARWLRDCLDSITDDGNVAGEAFLIWDALDRIDL